MYDDCADWLEDFIVEPLHIAGGFAYPPPGAVGLGVEVDMDAVAKWSRPGQPVDEERPRPPAIPVANDELLARL